MVEKVLYKRTFIKGQKYHTDDLYECSIDKFFKKPKDDELSDDEICTKSIKLIITENKKGVN